MDITKDAQQDSAPFVCPERLELPGYAPVGHVSKKQIAAATLALRGAARPLLVAGGGVVKSDAAPKLAHFARTWGIPVATTGKARGMLPGFDSLNLGIVPA